MTRLYIPVHLKRAENKTQMGESGMHTASSDVKGILAT